MNDIVKKILYPNKILGFLVFNVCMISIIYIFIKGMEKSVLSYCVYPFAFYSVVFFCVWMYEIIKEMHKKVNEIKIYQHYKNNINIKIKSSLYFNVFMNILFGTLNLILGLYHNSYWFITFAVYYILLSFMRIILLVNVDKKINLEKENKILKSCGIILLLMNIVFSGIIVLILMQNKFFSYGEYFIYVVAMYDFYLIVYAIINVIRYWKSNRPIFSASKYINLTTAMISMLSLETAMITQFGEVNSSEFYLVLIASTGFGICFINSMMAIIMIIKSNKL